MKKFLFILFFFLGFTQTYAEGTVCSLAGNTIGVRQNIYSTGGYLFTVQDSGPSYHYFRTYDIKNCTLISLVGNNSASFGTNINYVFFTPHIDIYINYVTNGYTDTILVNRNTGQTIQNTFHNNGNVAPRYKVLQDSIWISNTYNNATGIQISLTGATYQNTVANPGSIKAINSYQYTCNYLGSNTSACFYKRVDNTGIYYTLSDNVDYSMINDTGILNWNLYYMSGYSYLIGDFGSNYNATYKFQTNTGIIETLTGKVVSSVFSSGGVLYNAFVNVPYSQQESFPQYDFNAGGWPNIWTDYTTGISYYERSNSLYNNNTGALLLSYDTTIPSGGGTGENGGYIGTGTINITQCAMDVDNDGDVSFLDGEFFIGLYNCVVYGFNSINSGLSSLYEFTNVIKDIGNVSNTGSFTSWILGVETANASEMTDAFNQRDENSFLYKILNYIQNGMYFILIVAGILFIIMIKKGRT